MGTDTKVYSNAEIPLRREVTIDWGQISNLSPPLEKNKKGAGKPYCSPRIFYSFLDK